MLAASSWRDAHGRAHAARFPHVRPIRAVRAKKTEHEMPRISPVLIVTLGSLAAGFMCGLLLSSSAQAQGMVGTAQKLNTNLARAHSITWKSVNAYRAQNGRPPLKVDVKLMRAAAGYAQYLVKEQKRGHDADGRNIAQRITAAGYKHCAHNENVYSQTQYPQPLTAEAFAAGTMKGWRKSADHNTTMLSTAYTQAGIGVAGMKHAENWVYRSVMVFARPC